MNPEGLKPTSLMYESNQSFSQFGVSVKSAGDVNGDGIKDLIIGSQSFGQNSEGAAFIFRDWGTALPVQLVNFEATALDNTIELQWSTSDETNSDHFEVQKADNLNKWIAIGQVAANENTIVPQKYNFSDPKPMQGQNSYRLKMIDKDQTYAYSSIQSVRFEESEHNLSVIYPNPATKTIRINSAAPTTISFFSVEGKQALKRDSPKIDEDIDVSCLRPGIYSVLMSFPDGSTTTGKILIE